MNAASNGALSPRPFAAFEREIVAQSSLRAGITAAYRPPEPDCVPRLIEEARLAPPVADAARLLARRLVTALRASGSRGGVEALIQEFSLSSQEGVALMCLAEALLRTPDEETRDRLIAEFLPRESAMVAGAAAIASVSSAESKFLPLLSENSD
jgi:RHH-type proline utilization regulon transcriptional repressor/proline dehydrogenase/delta 1-pyrroline-5-carboxylate dehydrogenase